MTTLIRGLAQIKSEHQGAIVTIGNFDGVHLGHKALIQEVKTRARHLKKPSIVVSFEPQPLEFFSKNLTVPRLTRFREKYKALAETGIDHVLILPFTQALASMSPEAFIEKVLIQGLQTNEIIIGSDFRFGRERQGDVFLLRKKGLAVTVSDTVFFNNERVSSTRIRQALSEGNLAVAEQLLGRPYTLQGRIVHGDKLGRQLGFPTANIYLHRPLTAVQGIYVVRMQGIENHPLPGVANVGTRPTIGGTRSLLEVYLLDFNRDIYGKHVSVEFCKKLRAEERFANLDLLTNAIADDVQKARHYFKECGEL